MIDPLTLRMWLYRMLLVGLAGLITFVHILPLSNNSGGLPGPDLVLSMVLAWVIRRPEYVPVYIVALLVFLIDMLSQHPPGLRAALVVLGLEFLRQRQAGSTDMPFVAEWILVVLVMAGIVLGERLVLAVFLVEQVSLGKTLLRLVISGATYPIVVAFSIYVLGVRRLQPGEADALRHGV